MLPRDYCYILKHLLLEVFDGAGLRHRLAHHVHCLADHTAVLPLIGNRHLIALNAHLARLQVAIGIYKKRWAIESLFKQVKQNFPLRYFYGESANAIKIQIWVTLIANLLLTLMQRSVKRPWSFSGMATMTRILLMYYVDYLSFFENPEKEWLEILARADESPPELELVFR